MPDSYIRTETGIWRCFDGERIELAEKVEPLEELNRLARLVDDTANLVRRTERTVVRNILLNENIRPEDLVEQPKPRDEPAFIDHGVAVSRGYYNRLLRTLRTIWEKTA